ncbi:MAG: phosphoribosylglycinamide formyltransferase [Bacteroidales bacterium]|jgi:phosphoribosylglycinamide formyltransferase-1|nr:phosphoribosylglycinamide formyltransferase [Bacteroidales bacterium]MDD4702760.1 phosphoribosylglycinamide formyltransferase [Bacteroidales bacterium]MDX9799587.1 phosphoribosylglycinamide formyltransferase [Bacteroidales bacterium]
MKKIAIFASGNGTNLQRIAEYFKESDEIKVDIVIVNKKDAYAIERAKNLGIEYIYYNREEFYNSEKVLKTLMEREIDLIVLAGFLWLMPKNILKQFPNKIINIHPALLPKYGGKGMYGHHVHQAIVENKEKESGISIHFVNENYDEGEIIFQAKCEVGPEDTAETLADKIHILEQEHFPKIIESVLGRK